jgi:hypothetical protein
MPGARALLLFFSRNTAKDPNPAVKTALRRH